MTEIVDIAHRRLEGVPRYRPGKPPAGHLAGKLSSNESVLGPGPNVIKALGAAARGVAHYPQEDAVIRGLADAYGVAPESVLLTNGSDELVQLVATLFLSSGQAAVMGDPCYAIDATATLIAGGEVRRVPLVDGAHDLEAMTSAAQDAAVLWLPSPHNPTGVAIRPEHIDSLLRNVPTTCLVVLDLAYHDYVDDAYRLDIADILARNPHLLIQQTMSKAQALAGLRVGVALSGAELVASLRTARLPFSVNALGLAALQAVLEAPAWGQMGVARIREGRERLQQELDELGIEYIPSQANFVLVHLAHADVQEILARYGITVRDGGDLGMPGWSRITIGWAPTMADLRRALRECQAHATNPIATNNPTHLEGEE